MEILPKLLLISYVAFAILLSVLVAFFEACSTSTRYYSSFLLCLVYPSFFADLLPNDRVGHHLSKSPVDFAESTLRILTSKLNIFHAYFDTSVKFNSLVDIHVYIHNTVILKHENRQINRGSQANNPLGPVELLACLLGTAATRYACFSPLLILLPCVALAAFGRLHLRQP